MNERPEARPKAAAYRQRPAPLVLRPPALEAQPSAVLRYRLTFAKEGDARFLSHRNVMDLFERAFRGSGAPVRFTQGFNPGVKMSMGPALALGVSSRHEVFDVETHAEIDRTMEEEIARRLVAGVRLLGVERLEPGAPPLSKTVTAAVYRIGPPAGAPAPAEASHPAILAVEAAEGGALRVTVNLDQRRGPMLGPRALVEALFKVEGEAWHAFAIERERTVLGGLEAVAV